MEFLDSDDPTYVRALTAVIGWKIIKDQTWKKFLQPSWTFQELVKTKSPTELAQINSLSEFPVPSSIKNLLSPAERAKKAEEKKRRS